MRTNNRWVIAIAGRGGFNSAADPGATSARCRESNHSANRALPKEMVVIASRVNNALAKRRW